MDNVFSPPQAELEQAEPRARGRRLRPGWGPVEVLQVAWEVMQRDLLLWLAVAGILFVVNLGFNFLTQGAVIIGPMLAEALGANEELGALVSGAMLLGASALSWLVQIYFYVGQVRLSLAAVRGAPFELGRLFSGYDLLLPALGASVLVGIGTMFGMVLLFVPGVVFLLGILLYLYVMVDQGRGVVECLQESWRITTGYRLDLFMTFLLGGILMFFVGICTCFLGFIAAAPLWALMLALIYETLAFPETVNP